MKTLSLLSLTVAVLLAAGCADTPATPAGPAAAALGRKFVAVRKDQPNRPADAVVIARQSQATPEQAAIARKRVIAFLVGLKPAEKNLVEAGRYICVTTKRTAGSPGSVTCMSWDTQTQSFVGNNAYDLINAPPVPSTVKFPTFTATYVGEGSSGVFASL